MTKRPIVSNLLILVLPNKKELSDDEDDNEEAFKNVVSSRGKFASFLHLRNSSIEYIFIFLVIDGNDNKPKNKGLQRASQILTKSFANMEKNDDLDLMVNPKNVSVEDVFI